MRRPFLRALLSVVFLLVGSRAMGQELPKADGKTSDLKIANGYNVNVMIELYQDGKLIRTREFAPQFVSPTETTFTKLKPGKYEVHFLAQSYKTFVKRVLLAEEDPMQTITVELNTNGGVIGGGVSLQELIEQVAQLKKENAEIRAEIEKLKGKK